MTETQQDPFDAAYPSRETLELAFQAVRRARVPQIPDVVLGLRDELARPEPRLDVAADLIAQDLAMTGQVLKTVNSPLFRSRAKIGSVHQAVVMMGLDRLTNLVTAEAIGRMLGATAGPARVVWESMMEQAAATVAIARCVPEVGAEEAYLFGVMQDVGSLIFADLVEGYGAEWILRAHAEPQRLLAFERAALGVEHTAVGFLLAGNWRLPEPIALAIYHQHTSSGVERLSPKVRALVAISKLAHVLLALSRGSQDAGEMPAYREAAQQELELSAAHWSGLCELAQEGVWIR